MEMKIRVARSANRFTEGYRGRRHLEHRRLTAQEIMRTIMHEQHHLKAFQEDLRMV
jgi:hypothetical protein